MKASSSASKSAAVTGLRFSRFEGALRERSADLSLRLDLHRVRHCELDQAVCKAACC